MTRSASKTVYLGLLCLSVALPVGMVWWSMEVALAGKSLGHPASEFTFFSHGAVGKEHTYWHLSTPFARDLWTPFKREWRLKRLNLETGDDVATDIILRGTYCKLLWHEDDLYLVTDEEIYQFDGTTLLTMPKGPALPANLDVEPFFYQGRLTLIEEFAEGRFRLRSFSDDRWIIGREIALPYGHPRWALDSDGELDHVESYTTPSYSACKLIATPVVREIVLYVFHQDFSAYRRGFEFVESLADVASARVPENAAMAVSGWKSDGTVMPWGSLQNICESSEGTLIASGGRLFLQGTNGAEAQIILPSIPIRMLTIVAPLDNAGIYLIGEPARWDEYWGEATIQRIANNEVLPIHAEVKGFVEEYLRRWQILVAGVVGGWCLHVLLVTISIEVFIRGASRADISNGVQEASLASTSRRALASIVDVGVPMVLIRIAWSLLTGQPLIPTADQLLRLEFSIDDYLTYWDSYYRDSALRQAARVFLPDTQKAPVLSFAFIGLIVAWLSVQYWDEGQRGVTPGKWLMGIRTNRSDLHPCGFARSCLRLCLLVLDLGFFVTPLPAAISILLSKENQRLGDRLADTVVVRAQRKTGVVN